MATASEASVIAGHRLWRDRVYYYRLRSAIAIMSEDPGTTSHAERVTYAKLVISGVQPIDDYALGVATNSTIQAALDPDAGSPTWGVPDNDVEFTVNSLINAFAGIST